MFFKLAYKLSPLKTHNKHIKHISWITSIGMIMSSMALLICLAVFNGTSQIIEDIYTSLDPNIRIASLHGKYLKSIPNLSKYNKDIVIINNLEEMIFLKNNEYQTIAKLKAVDDVDFLLSHCKRNRFIKFDDNNKSSSVFLGSGVYGKLHIDPQTLINGINIYIPKIDIQFSTIDNSNIYNSSIIYPTGIFTIEKQFDDNYIIVSLNDIHHIVKNNHITSIDIFSSDKDIMKNICEDEMIKNEFKIIKKYDIKKNLTKSLMFEKIILIGMILIIIIIASLNLFFVLKVNAMDKLREINILKSLGFRKSYILQIFTKGNYLFGFINSFLGITLALLIIYFQHTLGIIKLNTQTSLLESYPIDMNIIDFLFVLLVLISIILFITKLSIYQLKKYL